MSAMLTLTLFQEVNKGRCNAQKHCFQQYFAKRRRLIRGAIYIYICACVYIHIDLHM